MAWKIVNNADTGSATVFGGNDGDKMSQLFSGISIADKVDINSGWQFRDDKLEIRNPANTFSYIISTNAITADRTLNLPLITGTDTVAVLGLAQTFSNKVLDATCSFSGALDATIVQTNQSNDMGDFDFSVYDDRLRIWNPAHTFRYKIISQAIAADRNLNLPLITGTDTLAATGITNNFTAHQDITTESGASDALYLKRTDVHSGGTFNDLNWVFLNSSLAQVTYVDIRGEIDDDTAGSEDGKLRINIMQGGSKLERMRLENDGQLHIIGDSIPLLTLYDTNTDNASQGATIRMRGQDSVGNDQDYINLWNYVDDWTNGSEDSSFAIDISIAGTMINEFWFTKSSIGTRNGSTSNWGYIDTSRILSSSKSNYLANADGSVIVGFSGSGNASSAVNTTNEFDLLNTTVPANSMGANGFVRAVVRGYILQNDAVGCTFTFRTRLGGTIVHSDVTASYAQSATKLPFRYEVDVYNKNSTSSNGANGLLMINDTAGASTGIGDLGDDEISVNANFDSEGADTSIATTSDMSLRVTVQLSNASASTQCTKKHNHAEIVYLP
jgi:hypothetical protein